MLLKVLSYVLLALGLPGLVFWALLVFSLSPGLWASAIFLTLPVIPLLLWLFTQNGSKASLRARDLALDGAYSQAILAALRASPVERDAAGIAQVIGLSVEQTERLLTTLNADEQMTSRVTDEGELLFGVAEPARLRIAEIERSAQEHIVDAELEEQHSVDSSLRHRT